ncbi:MAG: phosphoribosylformylglycinamidine cyclo-ligase, partial [Streptococcaceae bacterium]|nr:phosphoribosylformylglycinamidine cyclo-ligase [Streptococcaceae bacterium]
ETLPELNGQPLFEALLTPTRIYVPQVLPLVKEHLVKGIAHITGGGFVENIPRMMDETLASEIKLGTWPIPPIFDALEKYGKIPHLEMYEIFNMGIGMIFAVSPENVERVQEILGGLDEESFVLGTVKEKTDDAVEFIGE